MPKINYITKNFHRATMEIINQALAIIDIYQQQGFTLTLRQLYYQFVARELLRNIDKNYEKLGNIISDARRAGLIDWDAIEDRTRYLRKNSWWKDPESIIAAARDSYHTDLWIDQDYRLEVWIEKDALVGVIEGVCNDLDVPHFSCRGYMSDSEMWNAAIRHYRFIQSGQKVVVLHLGDHDPSGIDMTRDIRDRLDLFSFSSGITVKRIALTMDQVEEVNPPPNPAKTTDSRYQSYIENYGIESWELDALEPQYIVDLINREVDVYRDVERWEAKRQEQEDERGRIQDILDKWDDLFNDDDDLDFNKWDGDEDEG